MGVLMLALSWVGVFILRTRRRVRSCWAFAAFTFSGWIATLAAGW
jgi:hypothetical protein